MDNDKEWIEIHNIDDIKKLMDKFGYFHDSCLKELYMWTEHYVDNDLSMALSANLDTNIRVLFQRQDRHPSAIELLLEEVTKINITPSPENYDSLIYGATLLKDKGTYYWAAEDNWPIDGTDRDEVTWISARRLKWRDVSDWMGPISRYGPIEDKC